MQAKKIKSNKINKLRVVTVKLRSDWKKFRHRSSLIFSVWMLNPVISAHLFDEKKIDRLLLLSNRVMIGHAMLSEWWRGVSFRTPLCVISLQRRILRMFSLFTCKWPNACAHEPTPHPRDGQQTVLQQQTVMREAYVENYHARCGSCAALC